MDETSLRKFSDYQISRQFSIKYRISYTVYAQKWKSIWEFNTFQINFKTVLVSASCIDMMMILNMKSSLHPSEGEMNFDSNKYSSWPTNKYHQSKAFPINYFFTSANIAFLNHFLNISLVFVYKIISIVILDGYHWRPS